LARLSDIFDLVTVKQRADKRADRLYSVVLLCNFILPLFGAAKKKTTTRHATFQRITAAGSSLHSGSGCAGCCCCCVDEVNFLAVATIVYVSGFDWIRGRCLRERERKRERETIRSATMVQTCWQPSGRRIWSMIRPSSKQQPEHPQRLQLQLVNGVIVGVINKLLTIKVL